MKIITSKGIKEFEKLFNCKMTHGSTLHLNLTFKPNTEKDLNDIIWKWRGKRLFYDLLGGEFITLTQESISHFIPHDLFEEKRVWRNREKYTLCSEMDHQRLSNCVGLLEVMLVLNRITQDNANHYMESLANSIVPELEERFNGEVLDYVPYYEWEKEMYKEYLKVLKSNKK